MEISAHILLSLDNNDNPHISYINSSNSGLKYAFFDGQNWNTMTVDLHSVDYETSLELDGNSNPHISYINSSSDNVKLASFDGSNWNTVGYVSTVSQLSTTDPYDLNNNGQLEGSEVRQAITYFLFGGQDYIDLDGNSQGDRLTGQQIRTIIAEFLFV